MYPFHPRAERPSRGLLPELLVPAAEQPRQPSPHLAQPPFGELHLQVLGEHVADLRKSYAGGVMEPRAVAECPHAKGALRERVRDAGLDPLLARGAPVAVDRVLGSDRLEVCGDVFGVAGPHVAGTINAAAAVGTPLELGVFR